MDRAARKKLFEEVDLYAVTCERLSAGRSNAEILAGVMEGGGRIIQLREKELDDGEIAEVAVVPEGSPVANFGFDVTPSRLVTALVTERGVCDAGAAGLDWETLVAETYTCRVSLSEQAHYATPGVHFDKATEKGHPFAYHVYGTAAMVARVDCVRGTYEIEKVQLVHDYGQSINPIIDLGQTEGGLLFPLLAPGRGMAGESLQQGLTHQRTPAVADGALPRFPGRPPGSHIVAALLDDAPSLSQQCLKQPLKLLLESVIQSLQAGFAQWRRAPQPPSGPLQGCIETLVYLISDLLG